VSTETLRGVGASPSAPSPSPAPAAGLGTASADESPPGGASGPLGCESGPGGRPSRPGGAEPANAAPERGRRLSGANARAGQAQRAPAAGSGAGAGAGASAAGQGTLGGGAAGKSPPPGNTAPPAGFSQTLALSLSAPERSPARPSSATEGKPAKASAREADHGSHSDPVAVAMALMDRAGPPSPSHAEVRASASGQATTPAAGLLVGAQAEQSAQARAQAALEGAVPGARGAAGHAGAGASTGQPSGAGPLSAAQLVASAQASASGLSGAGGGLALTAPVGSGAWTEQLAARLTWMTQQGIQSASLHLSPRNLGPLQVSISVQHGQASVWFGATQPETREALTRALPELRHLFANQGLALTDAGVSHDAPRQSRAGAERASAVGEASDRESDVSGAAALRGIGLVDTYA